MRRGLISVGLFAAFVVIVTLSRHHATTSTTTTTTSSTTTSIAPSTTTTTTTLASANGSTCQGSDFSGAGGLSQGAAGTIYTSFTLTKTTPGSCTLNGWPVISLANQAGAALAEHTIKIPSPGNPGNFLTPAANHAPSTLTLTQGSTTSFSVSFSDVTTGTQACATVAVVRVGTGVGSSTTPIALTYPLEPCNAGTLNVSPFY